jgi:hypothetical protein
VGNRRDYRRRHPEPHETLCVIEVADSSEVTDLGDKAHRYAVAGMPMLVVIRVRKSDAVVLTEPTLDGFQQRVEVTLGSVLRLPTATDATVDVPLADLLPLDDEV